MKEVPKTITLPDGHVVDTPNDIASLFSMMLARAERAEAEVARLKRWCEQTPEAESQRVRDLTKERDEWKANHDNQVTQKRILSLRCDLPMNMHPEREAFIAEMKRLEAKASLAVQHMNNAEHAANKREAEVQALRTTLEHTIEMANRYKELADNVQKLNREAVEEIKRLRHLLGLHP